MASNGQQLKSYEEKYPRESFTESLQKEGGDDSMEFEDMVKDRKNYA